MLRAIGVFGFGLVFLAISPNMRNGLIETISSCFAAASLSMAQYSPISYVVLGIALLFGVRFGVRRAVQPR